MKEMDLIRLIEECGELIQAASKIQRFGLNGSYCDGTSNLTALIRECGDVLACIDRLQIAEALLDRARYEKHRKIRKVELFELGFASELTREQREALHATSAAGSK